MKIGDFFRAAPHCQPVNPCPVTFTAIAKGSILPGGSANPHKRPVRATIKAAFVFLGGGDETAKLRIETKRALRNRFVDEETEIPEPVDENDYSIEFMYQLLVRVLREWDEDKQEVGGALFEEGADQMREIVTVREANRLMGEYDAYVANEHPEVVDTATFRDAKKRGPRVAIGASR